jgi:transcriptional regulator with XRE-family HTH domain
MHFDQLILQIKQRREELQITQETLAGIAEVGLRTLKQFESGKGNPTILSIMKIAEALGMELNIQVKTLPAFK